LERGRDGHLFEGCHERDRLAKGVHLVCAGMATPEVLLHSQEFSWGQFAIKIRRE
jgi:hypothetical protein